MHGAGLIEDRRVGRDDGDHVRAVLEECVEALLALARHALVGLGVGATAAGAVEQDEQDRQRDPAQQHEQRAAVVGDPAAGDGRGGPHDPAVVQVDRGALRSVGGLAGCERGVRGTGAVAQLQRRGRVSLKRRFEHEPRCHRHAEPAQERAPARRDRGRDHAATEDRLRMPSVVLLPIVIGS